MNLVFLVCRSWNMRILEDLIRERKACGWEIPLVLAPTGTEIPSFAGVEAINIDPTHADEYAETIRHVRPEVIITYGWSWIIPRKILDIAPCLVLHPSPLPKYRGGSPIQNQLVDGVRHSAVTIICAADRLDAGDVLAQEPISFEGYLEDIVDRISEVGLRMTKNLLNEMRNGPVKGLPQDEAKATVVKRRTPAMSEISVEEIRTKSARYLYNKIRGLQSPYPEAFIVCGDGQKLFITRAHLQE